MSVPGPVVAVVGPTASGKSSLAESVALHLSTPVISVDAMQVYRGMDIGTAKTPPSERRVDLLMVDVVNPDEDYSARLFQRDARAHVDALLSQGSTPVLCGGTGLYLNAVIDEMEFPDGDTSGPLRARYESIARERGAHALHELLRGRDEASAALIHPNNVRRVVRALELADEGLSYARQHEGLHRRAPHYDALIFGIEMSRERLYERIERRVDEMVAAGLVEEVASLAERGLSDALTSRQAIGYKEILGYLEGTSSLEEAIEQIKMRSRRYAKRQISWFRHDGRVTWLDYETLDENAAAEKILSALARRIDA